MNKILYLIALLICFVTGKLQAQVFYYDSFSDSTLPGWAIVNLDIAGGSQVVWAWSSNPSTVGGSAGIFNSSGAATGHVRVDSDGSGTTGVPEYTTLTSNAINCTGRAVVVLTFTEFYRKYINDSVVVFVSTDSINWIPVFNPAAGFIQDQRTPNPDIVNVNISPIAANQPTIYLQFSWQGSWDYYWFLDDVKLRIPDQNEIIAVSINNTLSNGCNLTNAESISITFKNGGLTPITTCTAYYSVNGGTPVSEPVNLSPLGFDTAYTYTFTATADLSAANVYQITGWVVLANDTVHSNDTALGLAISVDPINLSTPYTMGFEVPNFGTETGGFTWTTEDLNADANTWSFSTNLPHNGNIAFEYLYNSDAVTGADDWLFSPCLNMDTNHAYRIDFFDITGVDGGGVAYPEALELKAGTLKDSAGMTESIIDFGAFIDTNYRERKVAFKPTGSGIYYVGFHCYSDPNEFFLNIDDVTIDTLPMPVPVFTPMPNGNSVDVMDSSYDLVNNWVWHWGDGSSSTGQQPGIHTYASAGTYTICLIVSNLSGTDSICHTITISGIKETDISEQIIIFPNPANRILNMQITDRMKNRAQIEIVNILGETISSRLVSVNLIEKFDLSMLSNGVYFVRITSNGEKAIKKFVLAR